MLGFEFRRTIVLTLLPPSERVFVLNGKTFPQHTNVFPSGAFLWMVLPLVVSKLDGEYITCGNRIPFLVHEVVLGVPHTPPT